MSSPKFTSSRTAVLSLLFRASSHHPRDPNPILIATLALPCTVATTQAGPLADAPGSWDAANPYYENREVKLVTPKDLGPTSYTVDYPPKEHPQFRAPGPYAPGPQVGAAQV